MNSKQPLIVFFILLLYLAYSCGKGSKCGKFTGEQQTISRDLPRFQKIKVYDKINIELKPSTVNKATITCGKNLVDFIITEVSGNELTIRNDNKCDFLRSYKKQISIILEYTAMTRINFVGAGNVISKDTIKQSYLEIMGEGCSGDIDLLVKTDSIRFILHTGNTNVTLSGKSEAAYFYSGGTSIVHAENMQAGYCFANNSGSGDFYLKAFSYLFAEVNQQGSIFYAGNPGVDLHVNGSGQITRL